MLVLVMQLAVTAAAAVAAALLGERIVGAELLYLLVVVGVLVLLNQRDRRWTR